MSLLETPLSYLTGAGARAYPVVGLTWGVLAISVAVVLIVGALLLQGVLKRRMRSEEEEAESKPIDRPSSGLQWIYVGVGVSSIVLLASAVWTMTTLAEVSAPSGEPALTIEITAHQWWWEARYLSDRSDRIFTTANEIHIPTGEPVRFVLGSGDVIHSFWVPALFGKTDAIPGQINRTWLQADETGVYRGQCTEYCGAQHAKMGFTVVAESPADFKMWRDAQLQPAEEPAEGTPAARGEKIFTARCGGCHRVRGTVAGGALGPDLTHLMSRGMIAAGSMENTTANLAGWIADPQAVKPGTQMPTMPLSGAELNAVVTYLEGLS
ncbi:MAG: cytochrome c oxidase subunit II [Methyloligella sp. ZOD6]